MQGSMGHKPSRCLQITSGEKSTKPSPIEGEVFIRENVIFKSSWARAEQDEPDSQKKEQGIYSAERPGPEQMIWASSRKSSAGSGCADKSRSAVQRQKAFESPQRGSHRTSSPAGAWWGELLVGLGDGRAQELKGKKRQGRQGVRRLQKAGHHQSQEHWFYKVVLVVQRQLDFHGQGGQLIMSSHGSCPYNLKFLEFVSEILERLQEQLFLTD